MGDEAINKAIGGVIVIVMLYAAFWILRLLWRVATGAAKKIVNAAPGTLEKTARLAGSATAVAEKSAKNMAKAFKEGRSEE